MLKIGEFSKLSHLTIKALRYYEKEGLLKPASIDEWNNYRFYDTSQLEIAAKIKSYRQLDLSIYEIKAILSGSNVKEILEKKYDDLSIEKQEIESRLSIIQNILENNEMKYQVTEKIIPESIVYTSETFLDSYSDAMKWIPSVGMECLKLNPDLKCQEPPYEFCEYLDGEYKETNIHVKHYEAVNKMGKESDSIKFSILPSTKVLSIFHKGEYNKIGEAYSYITNYAEQNGYEIIGFPRECYIDGIWNKEDTKDWLTEVQLPIK